MNRYNNGKIYKLVNLVNDKIYIGSTCLSLAKRISSHRKRARSKPTPCHQYLNNIGWDKVRIILIENVNAETKDQLIMREQHYIDELRPVLNKQSAYVNCPHGRRHWECKECGGVGICKHNKHKSICKECGGSQVCPHNRQKSKCKECNGDKYYCYECEISFGSSKGLKYHENSKKHKETYDRMFNEMFGSDSD